MNMGYEINEMKASQDRMVDTGAEIIKLHEQLTGTFAFNPQTMEAFVRYINLLDRNIYLRKCEEFLLFIEHCISVDKCTPPLIQGT